MDNDKYVLRCPHCGRLVEYNLEVQPFCPLCNGMILLSYDEVKRYYVDSNDIAAIFDKGLN